MRTRRKRNTVRIFKPLSVEAEYQLVRNDDENHTHTVAYIHPLIKQALSRRGLTATTKQIVETDLLSDIGPALNRFLQQHKESAPYRFSTYFTWYIHKRIEQHKRDN
jgi:hypothetical protein